MNNNYYKLNLKGKQMEADLGIKEIMVVKQYFIYLIDKQSGAVL